jgi:hypothetical protein
MGKSVQEVKIVGQRISTEDTLQMFDVMLEAFEVLLRDPVRIARLFSLAMTVEKFRP